MANFQINILGCGSATPTMRHMPSSQVIDFRNRLMMIDCGEGTQLQYRRMKLKFSRLEHIFISHVHGDHFLGLPGLLSTLALHDTAGSITIHTFPEGIDILKKIMAVFCRETSFEIIYHPIKPEKAVIFEDHALTVETFPLDHRVPTVGFIFREKPKARHIKGDMAKFYNVPVYKLAAIKNGDDFVAADGRVIPNSMLTSDADPSMSYAYCSDTAYMPSLGQQLAGVDTIYHESTYLADSMHKAIARGHSTAAQAGMVAAAAGAKRLIVGHYSKSYNNDDDFAREAATTFSGEVIAAHEGLQIDLL